MNRITSELDRALPLFHATIAFRLGSLADPDGKEGAARLLFRLLRRTAAGRTADVSDEHIDTLGAHVSADVTRSVAAVHGTTIARSTESFLEFLLDVLGKPHFDESEFEKLRREAKDEIVEELDSDRALVQKFWNQAVFEGHPYARPSGGSLGSLDRITLDDLKSASQAIVRRDGLHFLFAGSLERERAESFAKQVRAALPAGDTLEPAISAPRGPSGRHLVFVDKPERTQTQILIGGLGTHPKDPDHTALHVANTIFGGTFTARLSQEVRAKRGWSYGAYSQLPFDRERQGFSLWTFPQASDAAPCIALELELLEKLIDGGVSDREFAAAKKYLKNSHAFSIDTAHKRASLALDEQLYSLPESYYSGFLDRLSNLTKDEVNAALRSRLSKENLVITVVGTASDILKDIEKASGPLSSSKTVPFDTRD